MGWHQKYIGKLFKEKGRGPDEFDCWGLVQWVYKHDHPEAHNVDGYEECYESTNDRNKVSAAMLREKQARWTEVKEPKEFDVVLINMRGVPMHVGIVTKKGYMVHCTQGVGVSFEKYDSMRWKSKVIGFFRYE